MNFVVMFLLLSIMIFRYSARQEAWLCLFLTLPLSRLWVESIQNTLCTTLSSRMYKGGFHLWILHSAYETYIYVKQRCSVLNGIVSLLFLFFFSF